MSVLIKAPDSVYPTFYDSGPSSAGDRQWSLFGADNTDLVGNVGGFIETVTGQSTGSATNPGVVDYSLWNWFFFSWDMNHSQNQKIINVIVNGVDLSGQQYTYDTEVNPTDMLYAFDNNSLDPSLRGDIFIPGGLWGIRTPSGIDPRDLSDFQMWVGTYIAPTVDNLAKFFTGGKPVDPAVAAAAFGQQTILFSGSHSSYSTNRGTGGTFNLVQRLTASAGRNGAGAVTLPGATIGMTVYTVVSDDLFYLTDSFETTISVANQIQQTSSANLSIHTNLAVAVPGTITDASTSPSD